MADLIDAYARHLRINGRRDGTITTYLDLLRRLDRILPWGLARACAEELIDAVYTPTHKPATRALYRACLREFFGWATGPDGQLDFDPTPYLPPVRVPQRAPRPVTTDMIADILARAGQPCRTWYALAAYAGMRCIEIAECDVEHVTRESVLVVGGKGGKERTVPTHPVVWTAVSGLPAGPLARRVDNGERADRRYVSSHGNRMLCRLRVRATMHQLRHWYGTHVYRHGGEFAAQQLLGHSSPTATAVYALVASERLAAAVAALPTAGPGASAAA